MRNIFYVFMAAICGFVGFSTVSEARMMMPQDETMLVPSDIMPSEPIKEVLPTDPDDVSHPSFPNPDIDISASSHFLPIELSESWWRGVPLEGNTVVAYTLMNNIGNLDVELVSASSPLADLVEIHNHIMDENGVMEMSEVPSLNIEATSHILFQPGGYHLMVFGVHPPLDAGDNGFNLPIMLCFSNGLCTMDNFEYRPFRN